ncbi:MAG: S49 family peptidase [Akkermansiaceae bacterium]|nr:S49 family peptidase [Akkermansiaceae bacterium]
MNASLPELLHHHPWLITAEAHASLADLVATSSTSGTGSEVSEQNEAKVEADAGLAVIPLQGVMLRRPDPIARLFGATDTERVRNAVELAAGDRSVGAILLDIDSPGGSINGTPELATAVRNAATRKPVYAFSAGMMCSAAYWVGCQADVLYAAPSARIGSIGVLLPVVDRTEAYAKAGVKIEVFAAGKFKGAGMPGTSLTEDQRAWLQQGVEETWTQFKDAVRSRRQVADGAMEGQHFPAGSALGHGLVSGLADTRAKVERRIRFRHLG